MAVHRLQQRGRDRLFRATGSSRRSARDLCPVITIHPGIIRIVPIPWLRPRRSEERRKSQERLRITVNPGRVAWAGPIAANSGGARLGACTGGKRAGDSGGTNQDPFGKL